MAGRKGRTRRLTPSPESPDGGRERRHPSPGEEEEAEERPFRGGAKVRPRPPTPEDDKEDDKEDDEEDGLPEARDEELEEDAFREEGVEEGDLALSVDTQRGLFLKRALQEYQWKAPSPRGIILAPDQVAHRMTAMGPMPGGEEYAFSLSPARQVFLICYKLKELTRAFAKAGINERKGKIRKYGRPWPVALAEGQDVPPGIGDETPISVIGYQDIGLDGWQELYQAARDQWEKFNPGQEFGDLQVGKSYQLCVQPFVDDWERNADVRRTFEERKASKEAEKRANLARAIRLYGKFDEAPDEDASPSGPTGAKALRRATEVMEERRLASAKEADKRDRPAVAAHAGPSGVVPSTSKDEARRRPGFIKELVDGQKVIIGAPKGPAVAGPVELAGDVILGAVMSVRAGKTGGQPLWISVNKRLAQLGKPKASHLGGDTVQTYCLSAGWMMITDYDPTAPVYTEIAEVGAALTPPNGPGINLAPIDPREFVAPEPAGEVEF